MAVVGVASIRIKPDLSEFRKELSAGLSRIRATITVGVKADVGEARKDIEAFKAVQEREAIEKKVKLDASSLDQIGKSIGSLNGIVALAGKASIAFTAMASASQAIVPALVAAAGAAALIPAAAGAAGAALLTAKLGADGIKAAFDKLTPTLDTLKAKVSGTFQRALVPAIANLRTSLPKLTGGFQAIAQAMSGVVVQVTGLLKVPDTFSKLNGLLTGTATIVRQVGAAIAPLITAFVNIASVGLPFITQLTAGFGAAAQKAAAFTGSAEGIAKITSIIQGAGQAFKFIGDIVVQVAAIFAAFFSGISAGAGDLGSSFLPVLRAINTALSSGEGRAALEALGKAMAALGQAAGGQLLDAFRALLPLITGVLTFVAEHADAVVTIGIALFTLSKTIELVVAALKAWELVQIVIDALLAANPIGIVIVAIGALVAIIILIVTHLDFFRGIWDTVWKFVSDVITSAGDIIGNVFSAIGDAISNVGTFFKNIGSAIVSGFQNALSFLASLPGKIGSFLASLPGIVFDAFVAAMKFALNAIVQGVEWIIAAVIAIPVLIVKGLVALGQMIVDAFVAAFHFVTETLPGLILQVVQFFIDLPGKIIEAVANFGQMIGDWFSSTWETFKTFVATKILELIAFFQTLPDRIITAVQRFAHDFAEWAVQAFHNLMDAIQTGASNTVSFFRDLPGKILSAIGNFAKLLVSAGGDLIRGLWQGIQDLAGWLWDKITGFVNGIVDKVKSIFKIFSPSRVMRDEVGKYVAQGIAVGITDNADSVYSAFDDLATGLVRKADQFDMGSQLSSAFTGQMAATLGLSNDPTPIPVSVAIQVNDGPLKDMIDAQVDEKNRDTRRIVMAGSGGSQ